MPELLNFFPLTVYANKLGFSEEEREKLAKIIELDAASTKPLLKTDQKTWTGDVNGYGLLHEREEFEKLFTKIDQNVHQYINQLGVDSDLFDIYFTRSWGTIQKRKERIDFHSHMQSHISAVYYPRVPEGSGVLVFDGNPNANEFLPGLLQTRNLETGIVTPSPILAPSMNVGSQEDLLVVFPSKIKHATQASETAGKPRISISADLICVLKDATGHELFLPPLDRWRKF